MKHKELIQILDAYTSSLLGKYPHRYITFDLDLKANHCLYLMLLKDGYWKFAPSRSMHLVGYHQIVAFYMCAKDKPDGAGDLVEVHHVNGNTLDNSPTNLMYLSPNDHALCTKYQRRASKLSLKLFARIGEKGRRLATPFNKQGRPIRNWAKFMLAVICASVYLTTKWNTRYWDKPLTVVKSFIARIEKVIRSLFIPPLYEVIPT